MTWIRAASLGLALCVVAPLTSLAQESDRLRPDARQRPAPTDRPAGKGQGTARDPSIDDPKAVEQQDLVTRCRPAGAPTSGQTGGQLPAPAKSAEADETGNCVLPSTGQPLGNKAADKLSEPKR